MSGLRNPVLVMQALRKANCLPHLGDVQVAVPLIIAELEARGICTPEVVIGALATTAVECGFRCCEERGDVAYFHRYDGRKDLGNTHPGDGYLYRGRGYVQITGYHNYALYGSLLGIDLEGHPDLALMPKHAAAILVTYFVRVGVVARCKAGNWVGAREAVNGGRNSLGTFLACVESLQALYKATASS